MKQSMGVFSKKFWIDQWNNIDKKDSSEVHRGFSTPEFWDRASISYDRGTEELASRKTDRAMEMFERSGLCLNGMEILEIGCGTGTLAMDLARRGARVTGVDFSKGMLDRFRERLTGDLENRIEIIHMDWDNVDIQALGWHRRFDLTIAFMSPAVSTPAALDRMMETSKNACAMRGWAARRTHPILDELWTKIMGTPLDDKPQTLMIKFNLLVAMGFLPELSWDTISWENGVTVEEEYETRLAFFQRVSDMPDDQLKQIIRFHLESMAENNTIKKGQSGITGTLVWKLFDNA